MYRDTYNRDPDQDLENTSPYAPRVSGFSNGETPKSLNPTTTFEDDLAGIKAGAEPSAEEKSLREQAIEQEAKPEDAQARFAAQAADIVGGTFGNYAKAMGVSGAGARPFQEGEKALEGQLSLREQLHKNLLDKAAQKKAEREAKTKGLYEKMGAEMKVAGEKRTSTEFAQSQAKNAVGTPEAQQRSEFYKKAFNVDLDPATMSAADMDKFAPEMRKATPAWAESGKVPGLYFRTVNGKLETQQRKIDPSLMVSGKSGGLDSVVPSDQLTIMNAQLSSAGLPTLPEGTTFRAAGMNEKTVGLVGRSGFGPTLKTEPGAWNPLSLGTKTSASQMYRKLDTEATDLKKSAAKSAGDIDQLSSLIGQARTGNPTAASAAQRQIAMLFNKGALSNDDVNAFAGDQSLIQRVKRWAEKNFLTGALVTGTNGEVVVADPSKYEEISPSDLTNFEKILPSLRTGAASVKAAREQDIRRRAAAIDPEAGDHIFGPATQPSTNTQKSDTIPQQGVSKKRFIVDGQPRELSQEEFKAEKARGAKITR